MLARELAQVTVPNLVPLEVIGCETDLPAVPEEGINAQSPSVAGVDEARLFLTLVLAKEPVTDCDQSNLPSDALKQRRRRSLPSGAADCKKT